MLLLLTNCLSEFNTFFITKYLTCWTCIHEPENFKMHLCLVLIYPRSSFCFYWLLIPPWYKFPKCFCFAWDKVGSLIWLLKYPFQRKSAHNLKRPFYSYAWHSLIIKGKEDLPFAHYISLKKSKYTYLYFCMKLHHSVTYLYIWFFCLSVSILFIAYIFWYCFIKHRKGSLRQTNLVCSSLGSLTSVTSFG